MVRATAIAAVIALAPRAFAQGQPTLSAPAEPAPPHPTLSAPAEALPEPQPSATVPTAPPPPAVAAASGPRAAADAQLAAGRYAEALRLYRQAIQQSADPALLFDIAWCHQLLGEKPEAAASYRAFLVRRPRDPRAPRARELLAQVAPASRRPRTMLLALGGGAAMAVGAGAFFGRRSHQERVALHSQLHGSYDVTQRENGLVDDAHRANLFFVVGAALAAAGVTLFLLEW